MSLLTYLWLVPASVFSIWTLLVIAVAWTWPLKRQVPAFADGHLLLAAHNPKDAYLYQRPSFGMALAALVIGLVPFLNLLLLAFHAYVLLIFWTAKAKQKRNPA